MISRKNMKIEINRERLAATFITLCEISSPSKNEAPVAAWLKEKFTELGADFIYEDGSAAKTGADCGNLIIRFDGHGDNYGEPFFFSCHMDTVQPGENVRVTRTGDIFTSTGNTILGSDDKSGLAAVIEMMTLLREKKIPHPTLEIIITTCEEIGLLGAKNLEYDKLRSAFGYALDSTGIDRVIYGAPAANRFKIEVRGIAAHAGLDPETGINALTLTAKALSKIKVGRLDEVSTRNFGQISGGVATNIVPELITLHGEVRSHSQEKLQKYTEEVVTLFNRVIEKAEKKPLDNSLRPSVECTVSEEYPVLALDRNAPVLRKIEQAAENIGKKMEFLIAGGGSDANIFCGHGLPTAIVATGMDKVHTVDEQLDLNDCVSLTELIFSLVTLNS
jgi:tripeptide aminopeptidase